MDNVESNVWPVLDLSKFQNNMISGLSLDEINKIMNENDDVVLPELPDNLSFMQDLLNDDSSFPSSSNLHFTSPAGDSMIEKAIDESIPAGTKKRNNWAISLYEKWHSQRQISSGDMTVQLPDKDSLLVADTKTLDYWLTKFIFEIRREDGKRYPRNTLISIVAGINAHFKTNMCFLNLFKDDAFHHFREVLDVACKESSKAGSNALRQAETISLEEEELMWSHGVLGDKDSTTLIQTLLYLNGLHFALRSGQEHRSLTVDQIRVIKPTTENDYYVLEYIETTSKTNNGGLKHRKIEPKKVKHIDINSIENPSRSHALFLLKFLDLRPHNCPTNAFYLTPIKSRTSGNWYKSTPIGHNTLASVVKKMCSACGITGNKTNHSLRATCATRLYENGVDEQIIMERTGHRSTKGVRSYKRTSGIHHHNSSVVIDGKSISHQKNSVGNTNQINFNFHAGCNVVINNS